MSTVPTVFTEQQIIELSEQKFRWKTESLIDRVEDLFDDGLIFVHLNGHISSKAEWIEELRSGRFAYNRIEVRAASARIHAAAAVLVGKAEFTVTVNGMVSTFPLVYTEVYARRGAGWKLVNLHTCSY